MPGAREYWHSCRSDASAPGAKAEGNALHSWLLRLWNAVDTRDELFAICVPFDSLCVDKRSKRLARVSHSLRTGSTFSPGRESPASLPQMTCAWLPPPHPLVQ